MGHETPQFTPDTLEEAQAKKSRKEDQEKLRAKLARPSKPNPEALAAVKQLDEKQLETLRAKLANIEPEKFPEGSGGMPLAEEDEIKLTEEDLIK